MLCARIVVFLSSNRVLFSVGQILRVVRIPDKILLRLELAVGGGLFSASQLAWPLIGMRCRISASVHLIGFHLLVAI